jgi:predicted aconitase with swiveling domain
MGVASVAMVFDRVNLLQVQAVILSEIPAVYDLEKSAVETIKTGAMVRVDADKGIVEIL